MAGGTAQAATQASGLNLPINLGLNDGTYASERCAEALRRYNATTSFRHFPSKDNRVLREAIANHLGDPVRMENVFVANGSGPLLKTCVPYVIEKRIKASNRRMVKHMVCSSLGLGCNHRSHH